MKPILFLLTITVHWASAQPVDVKKLVADPVYSTIQFSVPISNGLTRVTGKFTDFTIDLDIVDNDITKSKVKAVIKVNSLTTGNSMRDNSLMSSIFFDIKKFPEITFISDQITKSGSGYIAIGQFQMHGISRPLELPFNITGKKGEDVIGFTSRYSILRSAYSLGMEFKHETDDNFIDNEIGVEIDFWTKRRKVIR